MRGIGFIVLKEREREEKGEGKRRKGDQKIG